MPLHTYCFISANGFCFQNAILNMSFPLKNYFTITHCFQEKILNDYRNGALAIWTWLPSPSSIWSFHTQGSIILNYQQFLKLSRFLSLWYSWIYCFLCLEVSTNSYSMHIFNTHLLYSLFEIQSCPHCLREIITHLQD